MSDGEFYAYVGLLLVSGAVLAVMAARGFGQARSARLVDAAFAAGFLGYGAYLAATTPATVTIFFYAFAVPVLAVVNVIRSRRRRPGAPLPAPMPYADPAVPPTAGFPPAPVFAQQPAPGFPPVDGPPPFAPPNGPAQPGAFGGAPVPGQSAGFGSAPGPAQSGGWSSAPGSAQPGGFGSAPNSAQPGSFGSAPGSAQPGGFGPAPVSARPGGFGPGPGSAQPGGVPVSPALGGTPMSPAPGGAPVSPAPGGFQSAATLFTGPKQPPRDEPPTVDPGSYPSMPSGLTGREGHEPAMRSGRPSGLPAAAAEAFPITPVTSGTRPSGLPRRVPTHAEQSAEHPAHVEFTQRLELPHAAQVRDEPAGPQPLYPAYPGAQPTQHWQSDLTQQFPAARDQPAVEQQFQQSAPTQQFAQPFDQPAARQFGAPGQDFADERYVHAPAQQFGAPQQEFTDERYAHAPAHYFERAQAGHAADGQHYDQPSFDQTTPSQHYGPAPLQDGPATHAEQAPSWDGHSAQEPVGRHGLGPAEGGRHSGAFEPVARHGYQEQPVAGQHWHQDPESFTQSAYRPAHGEQPPAYTQEPEAAHPAEWPPYPR